MKTVPNAHAPPKQTPGFKCDECGKYLASKHRLATHVHIHDDKWPFRCEFCGKGCPNKFGLARHERVHTGEKPFSCDKCKRKFSNKWYLPKHHCKPKKKLKDWELRQGEILIVKYKSGELVQGKVKGSGIKCMQNNCTSTSFTTKNSFRGHGRHHLKNAPTCSTCDLCEFGGLNENNKVMFLFVGEELTREGVIVEKDRVGRRLRIIDKGKTSRGAWYSYDKDFESLDVIVC